jgi:hypothetical protein
MLIINQYCGGATIAKGQLDTSPPNKLFVSSLRLSSDDMPVACDGDVDDFVNLLFQLLKNCVKCFWCHRKMMD